MKRLQGLKVTLSRFKQYFNTLWKKDEKEIIYYIYFVWLLFYVSSAFKHTCR